MNRIAKLKTWARNNKFKAAVVGVITVVVLGIVIILPTAIILERIEYNNAQKQLDDYSKDIIGLIGQPDSVENHTGCGQGNRVYSKGPLRCSVSKMLYYKNTSFEQANDYLGIFRSNNSSTMYYDNGAERKEFDKERVDNQWFSQNPPFGNKYGSLDCSISYNYQKPGTFYVRTSCYGDALYKHFPVD